MSVRKFTTSPAEPRVVYTTPCGRVAVERHGQRDYLALLDHTPIRFFPFAYQAEAACHEALADALKREAAERADAAAADTLGVLADGTPIVGLRDNDRARTPMIASADTGAFHASVGEDGIALIADNRNLENTLTDLSYESIVALRDFLNSGAMEALYRAAAQFTGMPLPAAIPVAPVVTVAAVVCDDQNDPALVDTVVGQTFTARMLAVFVPVDPTNLIQVELPYSPHGVIALTEMGRYTRDYQTILADPRFQAAKRQHEDGAAQQRKAA